MNKEVKEDASGEQRGGNFYTEGSKQDHKNLEYLINERDLTDLERSNSDEDHHLIEEGINNAKSNIGLRTTNSTNNLTET